MAKINATPTDPARCPRCNYDRQGLVRDPLHVNPPACPECGHKPDGRTLYVFGRDDLHGDDPAISTGRQRLPQFTLPLLLVSLFLGVPYLSLRLFGIRIPPLAVFVLILSVGFTASWAAARVFKQRRTLLGQDLLVLHADSAAIRVLGIGPTRRSRREVRRWHVHPVDGAVSRQLLWKVVRHGPKRFLDTGDFAFYFEADKATARRVEARLRELARG